ncbi:MAG: DUF2169 domain-containing protein [Polyangiaceae bacterium]|nr:DUF2169 domain-containing protein [Polyangiaceae bacterium]
MDVVALSPVLASRLVWRRDADRWALSVIVKATFDVVPGEVRPASQLAPIYGADVFESGNPALGLIAPNDLVPFKARADVLLVGHAHAPYGRPVSSLNVRLAVGSVDKSIAVFGNRLTSARGVGPALPFSKMSLSYERASGGLGTSNPIGMPRGEKLPNLEPLGWSAPRSEATPAASGRGEMAPPISFGPIAPTWPERASKHRSWRIDDPLPEDFDPSFFNSAPSDQQTAFLRGDETIVLEHLHPDYPALTTRLVGLVPRAYADRYGYGPTPVEMLADTLWIDADRRKLCLVWRGEATLSRRDEPGRVLIAMTQAREPMSYDQMVELYRALSNSISDIDEGTQDDEVEDELRSTNAVPAVRLPSQTNEGNLPLPSFDDEDSADDLPSHLDLGGNTRAFAVPSGAPIPDAAPVWLATPSRAAGPSMPRPPARPALPSHVSARIPPPENAPLPPPLDLVWDAAPDTADPKTLPPPADMMPGHTAALPEPKPEPVSHSRTGPLPVLSSPEAASPWAAGAEPMGTAPPVQLAPVPVASAPIRHEPPRVEEPPPPKPERKKVYRLPTEAVDLVWFDPDSVARISARFRELVDELDMEPLDPEHDLPVDDPAAARDRHHVFGVLTRAVVTEPRGIPGAVRSATDAHGRFTPPLVVVEGDMVFGLDERAVLKTTAQCAKPLAKENKKLQDVLASVDELLETPLLTGAAGASDSLLREIQAAIPGSKRALPVKVLEEHVERLLLSQRAYQIRTLLGGPQIRAALVPGRDSSTLVSYLPESVGAKLPLSLRFRARVVAEVHPSPDPLEAAPLALKVVALGRVVPIPGRS